MGALNGGVTFDQGLVGQAFRFNGIDSQVGIFSAPSAPTFTIEGWVLLGPNSSGFRTIYSSNLFGFLLLERQIVWSQSGGNRFAGNTPIPAGDWHHIALTYENDTFTGYVDGQFDGTSSFAGASLPTGTGLGIGAHGIFEFFDGLIDELSVYERALSQEEIQAIFDADNAGKCKVP